MPPRLLITAGPTHEPIDHVRYIGNRSSGRLGIALAEAAAARRWPVTLLLGPTPLEPSDPHVLVRRFRSAADLSGLLTEEAPRCDVLIMAAAVADYTPAPSHSPPSREVGRGEGSGGGETPPQKLKRGKDPITLTLVPTPDLLAGLAAAKRSDQFFVGFALEPEDRLLASAHEKLARKRVDMIVANPLQTMESPTIRATLVTPRGLVHPPRPEMSKDAFAVWLLDQVEGLVPHQA